MRKRATNDVQALPRQLSTMQIQAQTIINRKEVEALTNVLFLRKNTDKVSAYQKSRKKSVKPQGEGKYCEAHMVGTIEEKSGTSKVAWRIMGMRMK
ncbi:hypothetical protein COOONC_23845 [Cooperia oncophora]